MEANLLCVLEGTLHGARAMSASGTRGSEPSVRRRGGDRTGARPDGDYTRTWAPSGHVEYATLVNGTRLRYLKIGSGPSALVLLHTVRTQLDHFQLVIPKLLHAFTVYAVDLPGMG